MEGPIDHPSVENAARGAASKALMAGRTRTPFFPMGMWRPWYRACWAKTRLGVAEAPEGLLGSPGDSMGLALFSLRFTPPARANYSALLANEEPTRDDKPWHSVKPSSLHLVALTQCQPCGETQTFILSRNPPMRLGLAGHERWLHSVPGRVHCSNGWSGACPTNANSGHQEEPFCRPLARAEHSIACTATGLLVGPLSKKLRSTGGT